MEKIFFIYIHLLNRFLILIVIFFGIKYFFLIYCPFISYQWIKKAIESDRNYTNDMV